MSQRVFYPFYPERIFLTGAAVLGIGVVISAAFLVFWLNSSPLVFSSVPAKKQELENKRKLFFSFNLKEAQISFPLPRLEPEMTFSFDLPRPDGSSRNADLSVRFKQSAQSKRVGLPSRIDLKFKGGKLEFAEQESPFWLGLTSISEEKVQGVVWVKSGTKEPIEAERFIASPQASPLQGAQEFAEGSPFRVLAEARWFGHDVFAEKYGGGQQTLRIAIGAHPNAQIIDLREKDWIVWEDGRWMKGTLDKKPASAARIESADSKILILEGWDGEAHVRLSLASAPTSLFKIRGEEIVNSIRVRSEKQISCMMEKQCLILRLGDWVLKTSGRWKILRKKEEKEAYRSGKLDGELFVLEKIESKQGQKFISGFLFNAEKSQVILIDLAANKLPSRKEAKEK